MPCNGITVANVETAVDLYAHLKDNRENQEAFRAFLAANDVQVHDHAWWPKPDRLGLAIGTIWVGLMFRPGEVAMSNERQSDWQQWEGQVRQAYDLTQVYAGQLAQSRIYEELQGRAEAVWDTKIHENGTLEFRVRMLGQQIRVLVGIDGAAQFITEGGSFEGGIDTLRAVFDTLREEGIIVGVGNYESHRHGAADEHVHMHNDHLVGHHH